MMPEAASMPKKSQVERHFRDYADISSLGDLFRQGDVGVRVYFCAGIQDQSSFGRRFAFQRTRRCDGDALIVFFHRYRLRVRQKSGRVLRAVIVGDVYAEASGPCNQGNCQGDSDAFRPRMRLRGFRQGGVVQEILLSGLWHILRLAFADLAAWGGTTALGVWRPLARLPRLAAECLACGGAPRFGSCFFLCGKRLAAGISIRGGIIAAVKRCVCGRDSKGHRKRRAGETERK